jgi:hypothetical protein
MFFILLARSLGKGFVELEADAVTGSVAVVDEGFRKTYLFESIS